MNLKKHGEGVLVRPLLHAAIAAAFEAGQVILDVYQSDFDVVHKADQSPLTLADRRGHELIVKTLASCGLPLLSEEGREIPFAERRQWPRFWLIDPLDGTKEFIKRNGEFTVNIALIEAHRPDLGVIYVPVHDNLYYGAAGYGAFKVADARKTLPSLLTIASSDEFLFALSRAAISLPAENDAPRTFTIVGSRSHSTPEVETVVEAQRKIHGEVAFISAGSSLKICMVAEGRADLYPRTGPTMEWDTAAGHAIATASGAEVVRFDSEDPLTYNKEDLHNPWFFVRRKS